MGDDTVICKENADPNILQEKSENVPSKNSSIKDEQDDEKADVWSNCPSTVTLIKIMNDQKSQTIVEQQQPIANEENIPCNQPQLSKTKSRSGHSFPLPFNKMVGINNAKPMTPLKKIYIDPPKWPHTRRNNQKIEKLINKLSNAKRSHYRGKNRTEQLQKSKLKQQKAERRRLKLREQQNDKWQVVAASKKQKREALRHETEMKIVLQRRRLQMKQQKAETRYEKKINEKKKKLATHDVKIKNANKMKADALSKKIETQRKMQEATE